jgi:hypothetical protein
MRRTAFLALVAGLWCPYLSSAPAPPRPEPELPKGVTQVTLPEGAVTFEPVREADAWLVKVQTKGVTFTAARVFLRDRDNFIEFVAVKEDEIKMTTPNGTSSSMDKVALGGRVMLVVRATSEGGLDRIRAGDVIVSHPQYRIETGNVDHLEIRIGPEKPK